MIILKNKNNNNHVDLNGLARFGLFDAVLEVGEQLEAMFVQHTREHVTKQSDGRVDDGHAQWKRSGHDQLQ